MNEDVKQKLCSGRWILTILSGLALLALTLAFVLKGPEFSIPSDAIVAMLTAVFTSYFHRPDRKQD